mmetsp:Transcript_28560/g.68052  ORF Transcript_28560/g.68052 Transcript_28560/m.68052 type:complete len:249 (-) Transcript_28560:215-961(-)
MPSPKVPLQQMGKPWKAAWVAYLRTPRGAAMSALAITLLVLLLREARSLPERRGLSEASLGRRGLSTSAAAAYQGLSTPPAPSEHGGGPMEAEVEVLRKNVHGLKQRAEDLKAENTALWERIRLLTGKLGPGIGHLLSRPKAQDILAALPEDFSLQSSWDGGPTGVSFPGFRFFQGHDYDGGDIVQHPDVEDLGTLAKLCAEMEKCRAFNSQGWLKEMIYPKNGWYVWTKDAQKGIFIKEEYIGDLGQ